MNIEKYLREESFKKLVLAKDNTPVVFYSTGEIKKTSELPLDNEDIKNILAELKIQDVEDKVAVRHIYQNAKAYTVKILTFSDNLKVEIIASETIKERDLNSLLVPGYVKEWAYSPKGILFFYGENHKLLDEVRLSFVRERARSITGSSMVISNSEPDSISKLDHFYTFTGDDSFLDSNDFTSFDFNTYSFNKSYTSYDPYKILQLSQTNALITLSSLWRDFDKFWFSFKNWFKNQNELQALMMQETLGFIGVKTIVNKKSETVPFFEVTPFDQSLSKNLYDENLETFRKKGMSFNQSLHNMLLRRTVDLQQAYKVSPNPEELNAMLDKSEVIDGY